MAGKTTRMSSIKQLLQLHKQGVAIKQMARILRISKNTVKEYLAKYKALELSFDQLLILDDIALEAMFHSGNPAFKPDDRYQAFITQIDYFQNELSRKGVTRFGLWQEYILDNPRGYRFTQFCFHLNQQQVASKPSMVLTHEAGEKLFIDFAGDKLSYCDKSTGEIIPCEVFVATLPASDYCFAMAVPSQRSDDFLHALEQCLVSIGGVPKMIVCDNLKSGVTKANRYEPEINHALEDFANHYGTTIVPTRSYKPKDKALVENQVKNVYRRVYAPLRNMQFFDLHSLNASIAEMVHKHNQTRMQLKPYCREEYFLAQEKHLLIPLPKECFEIKHYAQYKVAKNNHIQLTEDKHYYSVPYTWIGSSVKVIYTKNIVRIYAKGEQIAVHQRIKGLGGYSTNREHLCSTHKHYLDRSPDYYITQAAKVSVPLFNYVRAFFDQKRPPEQLYRQCDGLLSLARKTDRNIFDKACSKASINEVYSYMFVKNMIENKAVEITDEQLTIPLPSHNNIRGKEHYQ
jgi:transposase